MWNQKLLDYIYNSKDLDWIADRPGLAEKFPDVDYYHTYELATGGVPIVGDHIPFYDDGKSGPSRRYIAEVTNISSAVDFKEKFSKEYKCWKADVKNCPWLYAKKTDFFIEAKIPQYDESLIYFVRTIDGGWFSFESDHFWMCGRLDTEGCKTAMVFCQDLRDAFEYGEGKPVLPEFNSDLSEAVLEEVLKKYILKGLPAVICDII